ncbi:hypothetical protein LO772_00065 [Yinghuangia sp. ASG 101]|uniref:hypothetical protein n=1 Tax=Yinghuangia sp. ASG 101 TaxID=2896848 RepID=UPI001E2CAE65|nr:hypothetical protein [Yinghuangia sp. ASG 101]UGQ12049.1 hypothetical protein LO772_00065 [Yinghuangia sp. ASG 101]
MPHPQLKAEAEFRPAVWFGAFFLSELGSDLPSEHSDRVIGTLACANDTALGFLSGGNDFYPSLRVQRWDHEPAAPFGTDGESGQTTVTFPHGQLQVHTSDGSVYGTLTVPPGHYRARISCRGREHAPAGEYFEEPQDDPAEWWVLQIWPALDE